MSDPNRSAWIDEPPGIDEARQKRKGNRQDGGTDDFALEPWVWRDPTKIPPRQWLLGTTFLRGYASLIGGVGGVGKTSRGIASVLAVITGRHDITGEHVFQTGRGWLITLEDDRLELERRIAAAVILHGIKPADVEGKLFINEMSRSSKRPLVLITTDESGNPKISLDAEWIAEGIREHGILFTLVDPLIKAHRGIENRNEHMDAICDALNGIAKDTETSVVLAAHFRKGGGNDGSADAFRGGSALVDATRGGARTLTAMSPEDAKAFNLPPDKAASIIREQNPKANMTLRRAAVWFELVSVPLGNVDVDKRYPAGDHVQALKTWKPPKTFDGIDADVLTRIFNRLRGKPEPGWRWSLGSRAKFKAATVIMEEAGKSKQQAAEILDAWKKGEVLTEGEYVTPNRDKTSCVVLNEAKIEAILTSLQGVEIC
jgi:hypothetical protein